MHSFGNDTNGSRSKLQRFPRRKFIQNLAHDLFFFDIQIPEINVNEKEETGDYYED